MRKQLGDRPRERRVMRSFFITSISAAAVLPLSLLPAAAQESPGDNATEEVVVTGSKIRRDAFDSISPVQIVGGQEAARIGTVDTAQMIAESPFVTGPQLDGSTNAGSTTGAVEGVPANGPGAASVALRGLGPERTLLLINGRRLAPSGVRGAPVAPDLNLIPSALIDRIEILTDGASSIYGADAVAGVANIILRKGVEGLELKGFLSQPTDDGGEELQASIIGGASNDRSEFTVAVEYFDRQHILARDRPDFNDCLRDIEVTPEGRTLSICEDRRPDNAAFIFSQGFVWDTPGNTDIGVPGWSSTAGTTALRGGVDPRSGPDTPYNLQDEELATQLQGDLERINLFATGEFEFTPAHKLYAEASYSQRTNTDLFTSEQVFPAIPATIPQEECIPGLDCSNPLNRRIVVDGDGTPVLVDNPLNPFDEVALPVYSLQGLTQHRETDIDNLRVVLGVEGDLGIPGLREKNWIYDAFFSFEESSGTSTQAGMLEPHIRESIDTLRFDPDGNLICGLTRTAPGFGFITPAACVPVNYFADSLFTTRGGNKTFASAAENEFLFGNVINTTTLDQRHVSGLITGDIFELPAGTAGLVIGAEYRENSIDSANDLVRSLGISASEAPDQESDTIGETIIWELYAETELPLHDMFTANLSGRYTQEEYFGNEFTYSIKADFRPTDYLRFRATRGTTFRAPNLREQFLAGQAGVIAGTEDPCVVPAEANDAGTYVPSADPRTTTTLDNCRADGVDPTALGLQANVLIPTETGGSSDIRAETSDSWTAGVVFSQPWTEAYGLDLSLTYFDIEVNDTVEEFDAEAILNECYVQEPGLVSPLCDLVTRTGRAPNLNVISRIDESFINVGLVTSKGFDFNARYLDQFRLGDRDFDLGISLTATKQQELLEQVNRNAPVNDLVGEIGRPEWSWIARFDVATGPWEFLWRTRYIDEFSKDPEDVDLSSNSNTRACVLLGGPVADTGRGPCVSKHFGDDVMYHDFSATYVRDLWSITAGIRNIFNEEPPLIDQGQGPARLNIVVQSGYDLFGRRFFVSANRAF